MTELHRSAGHWSVPSLRQRALDCPRFLNICFMLFFGLCQLPVFAESAERGFDALSTVQALHAAMDRNDSKAVLDLLDENVTWIVRGPHHLIRYAGEYRGRTGVEQYLAKLAETRYPLNVGYSSFLVDGDAVAVSGWEQGVSIETGGEFLAARSRTITVQNGVVVCFEEVLDSAAITEALAPADAERGKAWYSSCVACHGAKGEGNYGMHGSNLTVLDADYQLLQMRNFRSYIRGGVDDFYGWQMNARAKALPDDRALRDVIAFIETLPDSQAGATIAGNVSKGEKIYAQKCAFCHGSNGEGIPELAAPRLAGLEDWYQLNQLENYRKGIRGAADEDIRGREMRPYALALKDDNALKDLVAYIATLEVNY